MQVDRDRTLSASDRFTGGDAVSALLRGYDWSRSPLGAPAAWPRALRVAVDLLLPSAAQIVLFWGPEYVAVYNEAYAPSIGDKHPGALARPAVENWRELWDDLEPLLSSVMRTGQTVHAENRRFHLQRHGYGEEVFFDISYSPVRGDEGETAGVLCIVAETTPRVMAERRLLSEREELARLYEEAHRREAELQRTEADLRASEEQLRLATEAAEIGLWDVDPIHDVLFWPPRVKAMFGISADTPVSMADYYGGVHPDDLDATARAYAAAADPELRAVYDVEYRTVGREDGVVRWVAAKGRGVFDAEGRCVRVIGTAIDISRRKADEARLRELNETLEQRVAERTAERDRVWRYSRDLLVVIGADGVFRAVNPAWTTILGHDPSEVVGRSFRDFVWPEDAELTQSGLDDAAAARDLTNFENRYTHKDGTPRDISWRTSVEGDLVYAYGRDVTADRARQEELARTQDALRQAQKMDAVGQLTGGIAHDFNNLLQGVGGSLDLIRRKPDDAERVRRWADAGLAAAERGMKLTGQLLAFSRAQRLETRPVAPAALVEGMRDLLDRTLGPLFTLEYALAADCPPVLADPTQLEMAVLNLVINARDAMPAGGRLGVEVRPRALHGDPELGSGEFVEIAVRDAGTGMAPEVVARAFDPFFTTKEVGKGTGLGLSQVYGVARQAGGVARIASALGEGTCVSILLPRSAEPTAPAEPAAAAASGSGPRGRVLVIDDDADVRAFLADALDAIGFEVTAEADGPAGLASLERGAPDILLVDFAMPGMTGAEVLREARRRRPDLPVVVASGYSDTAAIERAASGPVTLLRKPFRIDDLRAVLEEAVPRAPAAHPAADPSTVPSPADG